MNGRLVEFKVTDRATDSRYARARVLAIVRDGAR